jgi:hypothetical protein
VGEAIVELDISHSGSGLWWGSVGTLLLSGGIGGIESSLSGRDFSSVFLVVGDQVGWEIGPSTFCGGFLAPVGDGIFEDSGLFNCLESEADFVGIEDGIVSCFGELGTVVGVGNDAFNGGVGVPCGFAVLEVSGEIIFTDGSIGYDQMLEHLCCGHVCKFLGCVCNRGKVDARYSLEDHGFQ